MNAGESHAVRRDEAAVAASHGVIAAKKIQSKTLRNMTDHHASNSGIAGGECARKKLYDTTTTRRRSGNDKTLTKKIASSFTV